MRARLAITVRDGLERSCKPAPARCAGIRLSAITAVPGIDCVEAEFRGQSYAPHRHDTYGIGLTLRGVQSFRYRGEQRRCLAGQYHVLHPDELHDGAPGTEEGFAYRIIHVDPALIQQALDGKPLPFVADPVIAHQALPDAIEPLLARIDRPMDDLAATEAVTALADALVRAAGEGAAPRGHLDWPALRRVHEAMRDSTSPRLPIVRLEAIAGLDRWRLARQFRAAFGTSLGRFQTLRRLDRVRVMLRSGVSPAAAAAAAGFADQAHMSRHFKRSYGLSPARWRDVMCAVEVMCPSPDRLEC